MTAAVLRCRECERTHTVQPLVECPACFGPLDVAYSWDGAAPVFALNGGPRSMWRYEGVLPHGADAAESPGMTPLVDAGRLSTAVGVQLRLKLEGSNPTHSFKDRIAASAVAAARAFGLETLCCASTGNLGDALAARCAAAGLEAIVLCPAETSEHLPPAAYGASVLAVRGSFDDCRQLERELEGVFPWGFLDGNLHPFAAEGAKTIAYELAEQLGWRFPDAVVCPVATGTLFAKLAQGFAELAELGLVDGPRPRLYGAQPGGYPPLADAWAEDRPASGMQPATTVRSLAVADPLFGDLAVGAARMSGGAIHAVPETRIGSGTALLAESTGIFADSAGGVAVETLLELVRTGSIRESEQVVLIVTGTGLKPYHYEPPSRPLQVDASVDAVLDALGVSEA